MRHRRPRAGKHDRAECLPLGTVGAEVRLELPGHLELGHAGADPFDQVREAGIGQCACSADGVHLIRRLAQAQGRELLVHGMQLDTRRCLGQPGPFGVCDDLGLHAQRDDVVLGQDRREVLGHPARRQDDLPVGRLDRRLLGVARVGQDARRVARDEQGAWPARLLVVHGAEAAEIALVRRP